MPWNRTDGNEQRVQFVVRAQAGQEGMRRLCRELGISREFPAEPVQGCLVETFERYGVPDTMLG